MHGQYEIRKIHGPAFFGEGEHAGRQFLFVIFSGCNMWNGEPLTKMKSLCSFCDAKFNRGRMHTMEDIIRKLKVLNAGKNPPFPVMLTGGEPGMQIGDDSFFVLKLKEHFPELHLETNGAYHIKRLKFFRHVIMSPKQSKRKTKLAFCHELKILYPFINEDITVEKFIKFRVKKGIYLQPIEEDGYHSRLSKLNRNMARRYILKTRIPKREQLRLSLQKGKLF